MGDNLLLSWCPELDAVTLASVVEFQSPPSLMVMEVPGAVLQPVARLFNIHILEIVKVDMSSIDPSVIVGCMRSLEDLTLKDTQLNIQQVDAILKGLETTRTLRSLDLSQNDLSKVESNLLARSVIKLESVAVSKSSPTKDQLITLCSTIREEGEKLRSLDLSDNQLSLVDPYLLASAVNRLEEVRLGDRCLTHQKAKAFFHALEQGTSLKSLDMTFNNLFSVNPELLVKKVSHLEELILCGCSLTSQQATVLCMALDEERTHLRSINLSGNDLSSVEPVLLANATTRLQEVKLYGASLSTTQLTELCTAMSKSSRLKVLDVSCNNLSTMNCVLLASAAGLLEEVRLGWCSLTFQHITAICSSIENDSTLKNLDLSCNKLTSVPPELLAKAMSRLESVNLECSSLTSQQVAALQSSLRKSQKLRMLNLTGNEEAHVDNPDYVIITDSVGRNQLIIHPNQEQSENSKNSWPQMCIKEIMTTISTRSSIR